MKFRYRLEGNDSNRQDAGTRRQAFYTNLRPGQYRFTVIASNEDGIWNTQGATLQFKRNFENYREEMRTVGEVPISISGDPAKPAVST